MSADLVPEAIAVLERAMAGQPGYGSLHILKTELAFAVVAHAYCAEWLSGQSEGYELLRELLDIHRATTPSATPPTHTVVAVDELERLRAIAAAVRKWHPNAAAASATDDLFDAIDPHICAKGGA